MALCWCVVTTVLAAPGTLKPRQSSRTELRIASLQTTSFLKLRWFVGTAFLAVPVALSHYRAHHPAAVALPKDAAVHIAIAWAVGALMSFLADTYRRSARSCSCRSSLL